MIRTRPEAPSAPSGRPAASRMVEVALLGAAGLLGCLLLLVVEGSRLRRRADAEERGSSAPSTAPLLGRSSVRRTYAVLIGVSVTGLWVLAGAGTTGTGFPAVAGAVLLVWLLLVGLSRRRRLAAARAADPQATVVLVGLTGLATMRLAQWAKTTGTRLPASLGSSCAAARTRPARTRRAPPCSC